MENSIKRSLNYTHIHLFILCIMWLNKATEILITIITKDNILWIKHCITKWSIRGFGTRHKINDIISKIKTFYKNRKINFIYSAVYIINSSIYTTIIFDWIKDTECILHPWSIETKSQNTFWFRMKWYRAFVWRTGCRDCTCQQFYNLVSILK